jgi:hypothetical protein
LGWSGMGSYLGVVCAHLASAAQSNPSIVINRGVPAQSR